MGGKLQPTPSMATPRSEATFHSVFIEPSPKSDSFLTGMVCYPVTDLHFIIYFAKFTEAFIESLSQHLTITQKSFIKTRNRNISQYCILIEIQKVWYNQIVRTAAYSLNSVNWR